MPPGTGTVVAVEWDVDGTGTYAESDPTIDGASSRCTSSTTHTYDEPGTYFVAVRVSAQREGSLRSPHARVLNLGRARVVVS